MSRHKPVVVSKPEGTYPHGTYKKYALEKCHCDECRAANREYERQRARLKAYGRAGNVDAIEARKHVLKLMSLGMGLKRIAKTAGISNTSLQGLMYGRHERGTGPAKQIRKVTADKLLAVRASFMDRQLVPARRTWLHIADMMCLGYSRRWIAAELGVGRSLQFDEHNVEFATAMKVQELWARTRAPRTTTNRYEVSAANRAKRDGSALRDRIEALPPIRHMRGPRRGQGARRAAA